MTRVRQGAVVNCNAWREPGNHPCQWCPRREVAVWMLDWGVCFEIPQLLLSVQTMWFPCELMQHISIRGKLLQLIKLRAVCGRKQGNLGTSSQSHPRLWGRAMSDLKELAAAAKTLSTAAAMEELLHTHKHTHIKYSYHTHIQQQLCAAQTQLPSNPPIWDHPNVSCWQQSSHIDHRHLHCVSLDPAAAHRNPCPSTSAHPISPSLPTC